MPLHQRGVQAHDAGTQAPLVLAPGFQMQALAWDAAGLSRQVLPLLPGLKIEIVASCGSTNTLLLERAREGDAGPALLVAEQQTHGRGRQGRPWLSSAGASLTFSLAMALLPKDWLGLSLAVGVALADALDPAGEHIGLKWPNDLWLKAGPGGGRKLGGVLIETVASAGQRVCVVGVGINVLALAIPVLATAYSTGYASLQEIDQQASAAKTLSTVLVPLVQALQRFEGAGFASFAPGFARRDLLRGQPVSTTLAALPHGVAEGVDEQGALRVRAGSTMHTLSSGEVSVRPLAGAESTG